MRLITTSRDIYKRLYRIVRVNKPEVSRFLIGWQSCNTLEKTRIAHQLRRDGRVVEGAALEML